MYCYKVSLKFCAAHKIEGHKGKCAHLHGHNWVVDVHVSAKTLNKLGMAIDFADIKAIVKPIVEELDHTYLNDKPYFQKYPPTAEHVARYIFEQCVGDFKKHKVTLDAISIAETDGYSVAYIPNEKRGA